MKDQALHLEQYLPPAGTTNVTGPLDLGVDNPGASLPGNLPVNFSDQWRLGRLRVTVPALPNNTNPAQSITLTLTDSADGAASFQSGGTGSAVSLPLIQAQVPGVAGTGSPLTVIDLPLPPALRGPVQISQSVPAGAGNHTAALVTYDWVNE